MAAAPEHDDINLCLVVGTVAKDATCTETDEGDVYCSFDVVSRADGARTVVPVTHAGVLSLRAGQRVAVTGSTNKRFFASGSGLVSRTDVRAAKVVVLRRKDQLSRVIASVVEGLSV